MLFQDGVGLLQVAQVDAACVPAAGACCRDAPLTLGAVNAGRYTLVVSQDVNNAPGQGLAGGFSLTGSPDDTSIFNGLPGARFIQIDGALRTGQHALKITAPLSPAVPEPATALMVLAGMAGLGLLGSHARGLPPRLWGAG